MALEVAMDLTQPRLLQQIVDVGIARHDVAFVIHTGILMIGVALMGAVGGVGCTLFATVASLNFGTAVRDSLFRKIEQLSFGNLDRLETGALITRLTNDVDQVQEAALMFLRALVRSPLLAIGSLVMAVLTYPKLSILLLVIAPILISMLALINKKAH
ncbi:ABC transporter ATP-binding protein, partial [bacterium]|nr:ABC transporter ATP-binding protein [bacterium]